MYAPWHDYAWLPDVVLIPFDAEVAKVDLTSPAPFQVARGRAVTDGDGKRQATLLFPKGTIATMVFPDGGSQPITALGIRATEYTVGPNGPQAMPADLPPTSGYTYAVEFSVNEAKAAGAIDVRFSSPLPFYVENFLDFPVGTGVPLGSYDRGRGVWVAEDNGRVIGVLGVSGGQASLDIDGDGVADDAGALAALGITLAERTQIAALYAPGQSLWRVLIPHFDSPWDANWPNMPPPDAVFPGEDPRKDDPRDHDCKSAGSIIGCQNQTLGEALGVVGTPFALSYQSERVPGRREAYRLEIPLSGAAVPASLRGIELEVRVAGQLHQQSFSPAANQETSFTWDGKNAYRQAVQGDQPITVRIGYTYLAVRGYARRFGAEAIDSITGSQGRTELTLWRTWNDRIGAFDARGVGLGGWTLSAHHVYDPTSRVLHRGDGGRQTVRSAGSTMDTAAGNGLCGAGGDGGPATEAQVCPEGLAFGPDGSLYIASPATGRVRRMAPNGTISTVAGNGDGCASAGDACGDGGPATEARLGAPFSVAVGPDGSLYIGEARSGRSLVRKVATDGIISTFAGTGVLGFSGDGGPARLAQIGTPLGLAAAADGGVYLLDPNSLRVRRVGPDGTIDTVAGTGVSEFSGDGGPAVQAGLSGPRAIAVGPDGSLYIADDGARRVRRVTPDGIIRAIAGTGGFANTGDGGPADQATFKALTAIAVGADDTVYISDWESFRVRWMRPGGIINTLAGSNESGSGGDRGPARQATLEELGTGLAVAPDGAVVFAQDANNVRVRRILRW